MTYILILVFGYGTGFMTHFYDKRKHSSEVESCLSQQVKFYGDLCNEESSGFEEMTGLDAHYQGVKCAVESTRACVEHIK